MHPICFLTREKYINQPFRDYTCAETEGTVLWLMQEYNRTDLLGHPVVKALLTHKWETYGNRSFYFNVILYSAFLVCLTYVAIANDVFEDTPPSTTSRALEILAIIITFIHIFGELLTWTQRGLEYFKEARSFLNWANYGFVLGFLLPTGQKSLNQWAAGAAAIFVSWYDSGLEQLKKENSFKTKTERSKEQTTNNIT